MNRFDIIESIGAFCLGFSLTGIFGFINGSLLAIAIVIFFSLRHYKGI